MQPHRVIIPQETPKYNRSRQTLAIFVHPDHETIVQCIDGSGKYPPVKACEDTMKRFEDSYKNNN